MYFLFTIPFLFSSCFQSNPPHLRALRSTPHMHTRQEDALQAEVQERHEEEFIKDKLRETEGLDIRETLQDQIRQCFMECRWAEINTHPLRRPFAPGSVVVSSLQTAQMHFTAAIFVLLQAAPAELRSWAARLLSGETRPVCNSPSSLAL